MPTHFGITQRRYKAALKSRLCGVPNSDYEGLSHFTSEETAQFNHQACHVCEHLPALYRQPTTKLLYCGRNGKCRVNEALLSTQRSAQGPPKEQTPAARLANSRQLHVGIPLHRSTLHGVPVLSRGYEYKTIRLFQTLFSKDELEQLHFKSDVFIQDPSLVHLKDKFKSPTVCTTNEFIHDVDHSLSLDTPGSKALFNRLFAFFQVPGDNSLSSTVYIETKSLRRELQFNHNSLDRCISKARAASTAHNATYLFLDWSETSVTLLRVNAANRLEALGVANLFIPFDAQGDQGEVNRRLNIHRKACCCLTSNDCKRAVAQMEYFCPTAEPVFLQNEAPVYLEDVTVEDNFLIRFK